ncbi:hypothetical protein PFLUV_G00278040, partial [Perca fluviatilis]
MDGVCVRLVCVRLVCACVLSVCVGGDRSDHAHLNQHHHQLVSDGNAASDLCAIDRPLCHDENSRLSFEAICSIHKLMDDDADGSVDAAETDEFLREDLKYGDPRAKQSSFHRADQHISLEDMWGAWKRSLDRHSLWKDMVLAVSVLMALGGCWFAYVQTRRSRDDLGRLGKDLEGLQRAEQSLLDLQE